MKFKRQVYENQAKLKRYITAFVIFTVCGVVAACAIGWLMNKCNHIQEPRGDLSSRFTPTPTVEFNGERYQLKSDITTILLIGIDQSAEEASNETSLQNDGQVELLLLLAIDDEKETVTAIPIDRDTSSEIPILGELGNETGTRETQICLAYGLGDSAKQRCELQTQAVSRFLKGIEISYYFAASREYWSSLKNSFLSVTEIGTSKSDIESLLSQIDPNLITNMSRVRTINELWKDKGYQRIENIQIAGQYLIGNDGATAFYADENALEKLLVETFFDKVQNQ